MEEIIMFMLWKRIRNAIQEEITISPLKKIGKGKFKTHIQYQRTDLRTKKIEKLEIKEFELEMGT